MLTAKELFKRRTSRTRFQLKKKTNDKPRLSVFRSAKNISAQIIDDSKGVTLVAASSIEKDIRSKLKSGGNADAAAEIGKLVAERAKQAGVGTVVFDRGGYKFHGRIKALADAARSNGLEF